MIPKKGLFSELKILEICEQVNCKENDWQELSKETETENIERPNITEPSTIFIVEMIKKIMTEEKEVLTSRNQDWKKNSR